MLRPTQRTRIAACVTCLAAQIACGGNEVVRAPADAASPQPAAADAAAVDVAVPHLQGAGTWTTLAPLPGGARQETAVVALAGKVYVVGGFDDRARVVATVEAYDPATGAWTAVAPLPAPLHHVNAAAAGGKLYVLGALEGVGFTAIGSVLVYDPGDNTWTSRAAMPAGTERGSSMVAAIDELIYVAGGLRGGAVADFSVYDPARDSWQSLTPLPEARDHGAGVAAAGRLYAIGGRGGSISSVTARVDVYDPRSSAWTSARPMPTARGGMMAASLGDRIVVVGGEGNPRSRTGVFPQVEGYDVARDLWVALPPMATARHGTGATAIGGVVYVPGGATVEAFGATAEVESFSWPAL